MVPPSRRTPSRSIFVSLILLPVMLSLAVPARAGLWDWMTRDFDVVMRTHGQITFAPYVHGESPREDVFPGYRSDFFTYVDFFSWKGFISNWLIANTTLIERPDSTIFRLDRIRYTLTPGYRYEFEEWLISGLLLHECIHTVSRHLDFRQKVDAQINVGAFLYGGESVWLAQNHDYRYEEFGLVRYHVGRWGRGGRWGLFVDVPHHLWLTSTNEVEAKVSPTVNLFLLGRFNFASLYYTWHLHDTSAHDNEQGLGLLGFKIVF